MIKSEVVTAGRSNSLGNTIMTDSRRDVLSTAVSWVSLQWQISLLGQPAAASRAVHLFLATFAAVEQHHRKETN